MLPTNHPLRSFHVIQQTLPHHPCPDQVPSWSTVPHPQGCKTKTKERSAVSLNFAGHFQFICCVFWTKYLKSLDASIQCLDCRNFSGGSFEWIVEEQHWVAHSRNSTLLFRIYFISVQLRFSLDKTTTRHWDFNFHSDVWRDASIQSRTVSGVGELKASCDVVNFMMFQSFQFDSIAFI